MSSAKNLSQSGLAPDVQIGKRGPRVINNSGTLQARNAINSDYINVEGADPVIDDHLSTKRYVDSKLGAAGTALLNFGAFPGNSNISLDIVGQVGILSNSVVDAWIQPAVSADHSIDEHIVDSPKVFAGNIIAGTGFTVYGLAKNGLSYGVWNIGWRWQ